MNNDRVRLSSSIALRVLPLEYCPFRVLPPYDVIFGGNTRKILTSYFYRVLPLGQYSENFTSLFSSSIAPGAILEKFYILIFVEYCPWGNTRKKLTHYFRPVLPLGQYPLQTLEISLIYGAKTTNERFLNIRS